MISRYSFLLGAVALIFFGSACNAPKALFSVEGSGEPALSKVRFSNSSEKATTYEWDFGDGNTSKEATPVHRYKASGTFDVTLKAINDKNKSKSTTKQITVTQPKQCLVEIQTVFGNMIVQLSDATPLHRDNFLKLAEEGFYDGTLFHRVIAGFMAQGGDPNSKTPGAQNLGSGGPGYTVPAEFVDSLVHVKGALAAARLGDGANPKKASSGSQFYIVQGRPVDAASLEQTGAMKGFRYTEAQRNAYVANGGVPFLDKDYTVFGHVIEGLEVLDQICATKTRPGDRPAEDVSMKMVVIK